LERIRPDPLLWLVLRHAERTGLSIAVARQHIAAVAISARPARSEVEFDDPDEGGAGEPNKKASV
jgi:hypothetical protein